MQRQRHQCACSHSSFNLSHWWPLLLLEQQCSWHCFGASYSTQAQASNSQLPVNLCQLARCLMQPAHQLLRATLIVCPKASQRAITEAQHLGGAVSIQ
jgi:hypothetical protein